MLPLPADCFTLMQASGLAMTALCRESALASPVEILKEIPTREASALYFPRLSLRGTTCRDEASSSG